MQTPLPVLNMRPGHPRPSSRSNAGRGETGGIIFAATDKIENRNAMERIVEFPTDRTVISTENNGFAGDERDETPDRRKSRGNRDPAGGQDPGCRPGDRRGRQADL